MKTLYIAIIAVAGLILFAGSIGFGWFGFPSMINNRILNKVVLRNGSEAYERWRVLPQPITLKYYIFNIKNPLDVANGSKPIVEEVGPFVFDTYVEKVDIKSHDDNTMSYHPKRTLYFNQEKSLPIETRVTVIDPVLLSIILKVKSDMPFALQFMDSVINDILVGPDLPFRNVTVREIMIDGTPVINCSHPNVELSQMACIELPRNLPRMISEMAPKVFKFALMDGLNITQKDEYRVDRGFNDSAKLGKFIEINGKSSLYDSSGQDEVWNSESCNMINGTDGTIYAPFQSPSGYLEVFLPDICRVMKAVYEKKISYKDVAGHRYLLDKRLLESADTNEENLCYCPVKSKKPRCMKSGVLDITKCTGSPLIVSFPHFLDADPEIANFVTGLKPNRTKHESFVEIEPRTGVPLRLRMRLQMNMNSTSVPEIPLMEGLPDALILPVFYFEMEFDLNNEHTNKLRSVLSLVGILNAVKWVALVLSGAIIAGAMYLYGHRHDSGSYDNRVSPRTMGNINMAFDEHKDYPVKASLDTTTFHTTNGSSSYITPVNGNEGNGFGHNHSKKDFSESNLD